MSNGPTAVLRIRNFALLVASGTVAQLGDRLTHMLLITVIALSHPGRLFAYSAGSMAFVLPSMLLAPVAGVLADHWPRRRILGVAHISQSVLLAATAFLVTTTGSFTPFWFALFVFFAIDVFNNTAFPSLLPQLVAPRKLLVANSVNVTFGRVATVVGMVAGGFIVRWTGWKYGLLLNASTHLCAGLLVLGIVLRPRGRVPTPRPDLADQPSLPVLVRTAFRALVRDIAAVVRVVSHNRLVAFVIGSVVVTMVVSSVSYTVLLYLVQQVLGLGTGGVGIFAGILAVGMIGGGAGMAVFRGRVDRPRVVVAVILLYGLLFLAGPWLVSVWFMAVVALVAGVAFSLLGVVQNTMLQEEVAPDIRGRVFSTREFVTNAAFLMTTFFIGALGDLTSYRVVLGVIGVVLVLLAGAGFAFVRRLPDRSAG